MPAAGKKYRTAAATIDGAHPYTPREAVERVVLDPNRSEDVFFIYSPAPS